VGATSAVHEAAGGKEGNVSALNFLYGVAFGIGVGFLVVFAVGAFLLNHERKRKKTPKVHSRWPWGLGI
jgi:NhaP-type Na+/H+ or K+/H+ antiporter